MSAPSSTIVSAGAAGSVEIAIVVAPESSEFATISVRIVASVAPGYASRRSSRRCWRSTRVSPISRDYTRLLVGRVSGSDSIRAAQERQDLFDEPFGVRVELLVAEIGDRMRHVEEAVTRHAPARRHRLA